MMRRSSFVLISCLGLLAISKAAHAGGFETPDNGTEPLGRGGAFTAKASDGNALQYNVAGLADQRGTRLTIDGKFSLDKYSFQRDGIYPDDPNDPATPWGHAFYPTVANQGAAFFAPGLAVSSDLGMFDNLTFAIGAFGPSGVGNPTFPLGVAGAPSPTRYDVVQANSTIILPTFAAAYKLADWLSVGAAFHYVYGKFDLISASSVGQPVCPSAQPEYQPCDAMNHLVTSGSTFTGSLGVMLRPERWLSIGVNYRGPINIDSTGSVTATPPDVASATGISTAPAEFKTALPWTLRTGVRYVFEEPASRFEQGDIELDVVYEAWASAQGVGSYVNIPKVNLFDDVHPTIVHHFNNTYSVRLGGAYNTPIGPGVATFRAGAYYESPATDSAYTRVDFNTLTKMAGTLGLGYAWHGVGVNVAYAGVFSPERIVSDGQIRPINPGEHGAPIDHAGNLLPAVNNGKYDGTIHMISFGVRVEFETLFGTKRSKKFDPQGSMASDFTPPNAPEKTEEKAASEESSEAKPEEPKAEEKPVETKAEEPPPPPPEEKPAPAKKGTKKGGKKKKPGKTAKPETLPENDPKTQRLEDPFAN